MADIDLCPRCQAPLKFVGAKSCECGWKKRERSSDKPKAPPRIPIQCAYEGCPTDATIRILRPTGWANVCTGHHAMLTLADAKAYTKSLGLTTHAEMRDWIKTKGIGQHGKMHGAFLEAYLRANPKATIREPGQDDEEIAA